MAVATLIALVGTSQGVERAWSESMAGKGIHMLGSRKNTVEILSSTINQTVVEQIGRIAGIKAATGELADLVKLETGGDWDLRVACRRFSGKPCKFKRDAGRGRMIPTGPCLDRDWPTDWASVSATAFPCWMPMWRSSASSGRRGPQRKRHDPPLAADAKASG